MVGRVVDDLKATGDGSSSEDFLNVFHNRFELGTANRTQVRCDSSV